MDKTIILSVAGSGKTTYILDNLNLEKRFLIITYTINNTRNLKERIIKKFGYWPDNIDLIPYFPFVYSFCFKPFLSYKIKSRGIYWDYPPVWTSMKKRNDLLFYLTEDKRLYHNRIAKLFEQLNILDDINLRMEKYYDCLYIDEIQDFAGHDFNLLKSMSRVNLEIKFVGDFFQHTFDTSRDGNVNKNLYNDYKKYQEEFRKSGITLNINYLNKSWRCSPTLCKYITENLGIEILSHRQDSTKIEFISNKEDAQLVLKDDSVIKLFYQESHKYPFYSRNWGDCKGEDCYSDVCIALNKTTMSYFSKKKLNELNPTTKNKLYVALTRAKGNVYLLSEELIKEYKT